MSCAWSSDPLESPRRAVAERFIRCGHARRSCRRSTAKSCLILSVTPCRGRWPSPRTRLSESAFFRPRSKSLPSWYRPPPSACDSRAITPSSEVVEALGVDPDVDVGGTDAGHLHHPSGASSAVPNGMGESALTGVGGMYGLWVSSGATAQPDAAAGVLGAELAVAAPRRPPGVARARRAAGRGCGASGSWRSAPPPRRARRTRRSSAAMSSMSWAGMPLQPEAASAQDTILGGTASAGRPSSGVRGWLRRAVRVLLDQPGHDLRERLHRDDPLRVLHQLARSARTPPAASPSRRSRARETAIITPRVSSSPSDGDPHDVEDHLALHLGVAGELLATEVEGQRFERRRC